MPTLRQLAKRHGISQRLLAKRVGVSPSAICQTLDRKNVTLASIAAVVGALGGTVAVIALMPDGTRTFLDFSTERSPREGDRVRDSA